MKNILISGVNGGMGLETAKKFLDAGYKVFGIDIQEKSNLKGLTYFKCDITNEYEINDVFIRISKQVEKLDTFISLAGVYFMNSLLEISNDRLHKIIDINSLGTYRVVKAFFPLFKAKSKVIITTSELATLDPLPFTGVYAISKSLLDKYAFSLRMELNLFDIDVVVFRPGAVKTNLLNDSISEMDKMCENTIIHKQTSKRFKQIVNSIESKYISPLKVANKLYKIDKKKHPKYVYKANNNILLKLLNILPDRLQVKIVSKLLK